MVVRNLLAVLVALSAVLAVTASSRGADDEPSHAAHGIVKSVDKTAGTITIDHEDIPGVMMAMTMTFRVEAPAILRDVAPGQEVDFQLRRDGDRFVVTKIESAAERSGSGATSSAMSCCRGSCRGRNSSSGTYGMPDHQM